MLVAWMYFLAVNTYNYIYWIVEVASTLKITKARCLPPLLSRMFHANLMFWLKRTAKFGQMVGYSMKRWKYPRHDGSDSLSQHFVPKQGFSLCINQNLWMGWLSA